MSEAIDALPPLREVIKAWQLDADKKLGQHFLLDLNLTAKIVRTAGELTGATVIEIGPGPGGLTRALVNSVADKVIAIERDPRCVAALQTVVEAADGRLTLIHGDALKIDPSTLCPAPRAIVANLPYNVATPLLIGWLKQAAAFTSMTLMFQREVALRLVAAPRTPDYGRLSVMTQWRTEPSLVFDLPRRRLHPAAQGRILHRPHDPARNGSGRTQFHGDGTGRGGLFRPAPQDAACRPAQFRSRTAALAGSCRDRPDITGRRA